MSWTITTHYLDEDVCQHIEFDLGQTVYYDHKKNPWKSNSKWVLEKCSITCAWATNTYGITLNSNIHICEDQFYKLFTNREEAIEFCLKKNAHAKVKIYGE